MISIPVSDQDIQWDGAATIYEEIDSKAAAMQLLGFEAFAWIHPDLSDHF